MADPGLQPLAGGDPLDARYERARLQLIPDFLRRHRLTCTGLAGILEVHHSVLSRFIHAVPGYTPAPSRPTKMELLERVEEICSRPYVLRRLDHTSITSSDPERQDHEIWFQNFLDRLIDLERNVAPAHALALMPEPCVQATSAPPPYGPSMCVNALLYTMTFLTALEPADASRALVQRTLERVGRLERAALERAGGNFLEQAEWRVKGYAAGCRAHAARLLGDAEAMSRALDALREAAAHQREHADGHWVNLIKLLDRMLALDGVRAQEWSTTIAHHADAHWDETLQLALDAYSLPRLEAHWSALLPHRAALVGRAARAAAETPDDG